ncbi:MAG: type II secretion system protein [Bacteroidales bacterium]|nr:type II secretion system protein [Bacteroidales bacterium]
MRNKSARKLPGFTLVEMLFVMLLGAIVMGLTYMYFSRFQQYLSQVKKQEDKYMVLGQLNTLLQTEFQNAEEVYFIQPDQLILLEEENEIVYAFRDEGIVRTKGENRDTFKLSSNTLRVSELEENNWLVSEFSFDAETEKDQMVPFFMHKEYTGKTLFETFKIKRNGN